METIDQLQHQNDRMRDAATHACDASQDFALAANGNNGHIIPAPAAYYLLGNIKVLLRNVQEITEHMPRGFAASLNDPRLEIYDRDPATGEDRAPAEQVAVATEHLRALTAYPLSPFPEAPSLCRATGQQYRRRHHNHEEKCYFYRSVNRAPVVVNCTTKNG